MLNFLIKFFALIGLIILIVYVINYFVSYFKQKQANAANQKVMPSPSYMQNSGIRCPDYLSNVGGNSVSFKCSNRDFNIDINNPEMCYSNMTEKTTDFPLFPQGKTWELGNPNGLTSMTDQDKWDFVRTKLPDGSNGESYLSRCDWISNCGSASNVDGVWQGVKKWCDMANPSQTTM